MPIDVVQQSADAMGVEITAAAEYPLGATDYGNAIADATAGDPDAIYLASVTAVMVADPDSRLMATLYSRSSS